MPMDLIVHLPGEQRTVTVESAVSFEVIRETTQNRIIIDQTDGRSAEYAGKQATVSGGTDTEHDFD